MRDWTLLKERLPELNLRRELRLQPRIAAISSVVRPSTKSFATDRRQQVKLAIAAILYHLWRLPPDGPVPATIPRSPSRRRCYPDARYLYRATDGGAIHERT